jgi:hypothetical protein
MKTDQGPQRLCALRAARNKLVAARATFDEKNWYDKATVNSFTKWLVDKRSADKQSVQYTAELAVADDNASQWQEIFCADSMEKTVADILAVKYGAYYFNIEVCIHSILSCICLLTAY